MPYDDWLNRYNKTVIEIFDSPITLDSLNVKDNYNQNQNAEWSALINIQENIKSFSFDVWMKYVDYVLRLIIEKDSSEIEDIPYYDLWNNCMNPLVISMFAIFNSSEELDYTCLPEDAKIVWNESKYNKQVQEKIQYILAHW